MTRTPTAPTDVVVAPPSDPAPTRSDRRSLIADLRKTANRTTEQDRKLLEAVADELLAAP